MANTVIAIRSSGVASNTPSLGVLANGELSLNFADGILYYKSSSNTLGSIRTTAVSGLTTEVQFNDAGSFGANANFTFNKSIATLNVKNINVSTNLIATTANLTVNSITTGTGVGGIIAGANVIYSNVFVANSGGYVQFSDGSKQYTANAGASGGVTQIIAGTNITISPGGGTGVVTINSSGGGTTDFGFGQIFTPNNSVYANATSANDKVTFVGESGVYVFANSTTKTITVAGTPGAQGMTVDYGFVTEAVYYAIDYGTL